MASSDKGEHRFCVFLLLGFQFSIQFRKILRDKISDLVQLPLLYVAELAEKIWVQHHLQYSYTHGSHGIPVVAPPVRTQLDN
jgi:hypothetical protein